MCLRTLCANARRASRARTAVAKTVALRVGAKRAARSSRRLRLSARTTSLDFVLRTRPRETARAERPLAAAQDSMLPRRCTVHISARAPLY
eukprot:493854-Pleurochrysis_carterae.AAC.2